MLKNFFSSFGIILWIFNGIKFTWVLRDSCKSSALGKIQIPYVLIKILAGCCLYAVSACAQVNGI